MQITRVSYSGLFNLGNYNNEKIGLSAELDEGDDPEAVVATLREQAVARAVNTGLSTDDDIRWQIRHQLDELKEIQTKVQKATTEWNELAEFLRVQGIKPEAPNISLKALMPSVDEESSTLNGELVDDDDEDNPAPF